MTRQWIKIFNHELVVRVADTEVPEHEPHEVVIHTPLARYENRPADCWYCGRPLSELPASPALRMAC